MFPRPLWMIVPPIPEVLIINFKWHQVGRERSHQLVNDPISFICFPGLDYATTELLHSLELHFPFPVTRPELAEMKYCRDQILRRSRMSTFASAGVSVLRFSPSNQIPSFSRRSFRPSHICHQRVQSLVYIDEVHHPGYVRYHPDNLLVSSSSTPWHLALWVLGSHYNRHSLRLCYQVEHCDILQGNLFLLMLFEYVHPLGVVKTLLMKSRGEKTFTSV